MKTNLHHPIDALGILKVSMSGIRVEFLEERVNPKVPFPHKHDFYQLLFITAGTGQHQVDFTKYKISKHQVFIIKPGQIHSWKLGKNIKGYVVEFNRESVPLELLHELEYSKDFLTIKKSLIFDRFISISRVMQDEFQEQKSNYDLSLRGHLIGLVVQLLREASTDKPANKSLSNIEKFRKLVEKNYRTEHRVEFYAKQLALTPKALTMQISRTLGRSPRDLIQERIILEAKRLLAFSHTSISEIGLSLGFEDANYFSRFFRLHQGPTPLEFRKMSSASV
jgi:AraC family transcriptional activator of pobA